MYNYILISIGIISIILSGMIIFYVNGINNLTASAILSGVVAKVFLFNVALFILIGVSMFFVDRVNNPRQFWILFGICISLLIIHADTILYFIREVPKDISMVSKTPKPSFYFNNAKSIALIEAALNNDASAVKKLISEGSNPNDSSLNSYGTNFTLIQYAVLAKNKDAVRLLYENGADIDHNPLNTVSVYTLAIGTKETGPGDMGMFKFLLELRPVSQIPQARQQNILFSCVDGLNLDCLKIALDHGIPVDLQNELDYTSLMYLIEEKFFGIGRYNEHTPKTLEMAKELIASGASTTISTTKSTFKGESPANLLEVAQKEYEQGTKEYIDLETLKSMMKQKGAVFPAPKPHLEKK